MAAGSILIFWDRVANGGLPSFNTGPINLVAPHLQQNVTDIRLAMIQGLAPGDFNLFAADSGRLLDFLTISHGGHSYRVFRQVEVGRAYLLRLRLEILQNYLASNQYVPYRGLGAEGHLTRQHISNLSSSFYRRVFHTRQPLSFRAAFVASAGTAEAAAASQARWFSAFFGCGARSIAPIIRGSIANDGKRIGSARHA